MPRRFLRTVRTETYCLGGHPRRPSATPSRALKRTSHGQSAPSPPCSRPRDCFRLRSVSWDSGGCGKWFLGRAWSWEPDGFTSEVTAAFLSGSLGPRSPGASVDGCLGRRLFVFIQANMPEEAPESPTICRGVGLGPIGTAAWWNLRAEGGAGPRTKRFSLHGARGLRFRRLRFSRFLSERGTV